MQIKKIHIETDKDSKQILAGYPNKDGTEWSKNVQIVTDTAVVSFAKWLELAESDVDTGLHKVSFDKDGKNYSIAMKVQGVQDV